MAAQEAIQKFHNYLSSLLENYSGLADLLRDKIDAVENDNIEALSDIMKEEQAYVLLVRGFDDHLKTHRKALGVTGETLSDTISELPEEWQGSFHSLYIKLRATLDEVQSLGETCRRNTETKLEVIGRKLREADPMGAGSYSEDKKFPNKPGSGLFDKSI